MFIFFNLKIFLHTCNQLSGGNPDDEYDPWWCRGTAIRHTSQSVEHGPVHACCSGTLSQGVKVI